MESRHDLQALRTAVPYIRAYKGRVFVIKLGGGLASTEKPLSASANTANSSLSAGESGSRVIRRRRY